MSRTSTRRGVRPAVTLLELVVAMAMMVVVFTAIAPLCNTLRRSWASMQTGAEALQQGRVLVDHLNRNLSKAVRITDVSDSSTVNGYIVLETADGNSVRYDVAANGLVEYGPVGNLSYLAGPVSQFQFVCYDGNDFSSPTVDVNSVRLVAVSMTFPGSDGVTRDRVLTSSIYLRVNPDGSDDDSLSEPGVAVSDKIEVKNSGRIAAVGETAVVSTNSIARDKIKVKNDGRIEGDAFVGPGGSTSAGIEIRDNGVITGQLGVLPSEVAIPAPTEPSLGPSVGDRVYQSGTTTISSDMHCDKLEIKNSAVVRIAGDVALLVEKELVVKDSAQLQLLAGATLVLYTKDEIKIEDDVVVNGSTADPGRLTINQLVDKKVELKNRSLVYATVVAPQNELKLKDEAQLYGTYRGKKLKVEGNAVFRIYRPDTGILP